MNDCAWDNGTGRLRPFIGLSGDVMIDRNGRRDSYERVKGEIFRSFSDGRLDTVVVASVNDLDLRLARVVNNLVSSFRETKVFVAQGEYGCKAET